MTSQQLSHVQAIIEGLLHLMEVEAVVTLEMDGSNVLRVDMSGSDNLGILIGYHGETLAALQTIIGLMVNASIHYEHEGDRYKVVVNIGDYRQRQQESLEALARRSAERVRFTRKPLTLQALSSYDRRIVHLALEREQDITSESVGEGRERRLVVKLRDA